MSLNSRSGRRRLEPSTYKPSRLSHSTSASDLRKRKEEDANVQAQARSNGHFSPTFQDDPHEEADEQFLTPKRLPRKQYSIGSGGDASPSRSPEIHYSPFATSTPPSGLSKSSSIPFDMAANEKAGRQAEMRARERSSSETPMIKRKAFIRRKPLLHRIKEYPQRVIDTILLNYPPAIDSLLPPAQYANPISLMLQSVHWLVMAPLWRSSETTESVLRSSTEQNSVGRRWQRWTEEPENSRTSWGSGWKGLILTALLLALATANAVYLFTRFRSYDLQMRSARDETVSPHASPVAAPMTSMSEADNVDETSNPSTRGQAVIKYTAKVLLTLIKWTFVGMKSILGQDVPSSVNGHGFRGDMIQRLRVWEPPDFCLAFFCAYPPSAPILSHLLNPLHPWITPFLHLATSFLLSHLSASYAQLVKDRMVLSAEVMREYDRRFVYKKVFATKVDRSIGTHDGPWYQER